MFYKFSAGEVALEPFIISCFLNIYHHNLFPIHWWVAVSAWFLQLLLILCSWLPYAMTQNAIQFQSTATLLLFYVAMLFINYRIHQFKIREFMFTETFSMNGNNDNEPSRHSLPSNIDESKIISDYLAEMYDRTPSMSTTEDVADSETTASAVSSVSFSRVIHHRQHHEKSSSQSHDDDYHTVASTITNGLTAAAPAFSSEPSREKVKGPYPRKPYLARERPLY